MKSLKLVSLPSQYALEFLSSALELVRKKRVVHFPRLEHLSRTCSATPRHLLVLAFHPQILEASQLCSVASFDGDTRSGRFVIIGFETCSRLLSTFLLFRDLMAAKSAERSWCTCFGSAVTKVACELPLSTTFPAFTHHFLASPTTRPARELVSVPTPITSPARQLVTSITITGITCSETTTMATALLEAGVHFTSGTEKGHEGQLQCRSNQVMNWKGGNKLAELQNILARHDIR